MKIYDCITFFNELDLLEIRLETLNDVVDYFVINEATITFQNNPKPLYYLENKDRFSKFNHKIIHNIVDDTPITNNNWDNDTYHKNCTMRALQNCSDDDIIIYSDADEIVNPEALINLLKNNYKPNNLFLFYQDWYQYYMNTKVIGTDWDGSRLSNWSYLKQYSIDLFRAKQNYYWTQHQNEIIKVCNENNIPTGWHYTWLGGVEKVIQKIESYSHAEQNNDQIKNSLEYKILNLKDVIGRNQFDPKKIDINYNNSPKYLIDNLNKFKHLIL